MGIVFWMKIFLIAQGLTSGHAKCLQKISSTRIELYTTDRSKNCIWSTKIIASNDKVLNITITERVGGKSLVLFGNPMITMNKRCFIVTPPGTRCVFTNTTSCDILKKKDKYISFRTANVGDKLVLHTEHVDDCQKTEGTNTTISSFFTSLRPTTMRIKSTRHQETTAKQVKDSSTKSSTTKHEEKSMMNIPEIKPRINPHNVVTQRAFSEYDTSNAIVRMPEQGISTMTIIILCAVGSFLIIIGGLIAVCIIKQRRQPPKWKNRNPHISRTTSIASVCFAPENPDRVYESIHSKRNRERNNTDASTQSQSLYVEMAATGYKQRNVYASVKLYSTPYENIPENPSHTSHRLDSGYIIPEYHNDTSLPYINMGIVIRNELTRQSTYVDMSQTSVPKSPNSSIVEPRYVNLLSSSSADKAQSNIYENSNSSK
ncbi:uncharacterized protein LOC120336083 [Styela clava]